MPESTLQREKQLVRAKRMFEELLDDANKGSVEEAVMSELKKDIKDCEEGLGQLEKREGFQVSDSKKENYARMWTKEIDSKGKIINKQDFDNLVKNKSEYNIFIIDRGEYENGGVGEIYINEIPVFRHYPNKVLCKEFISPLEYRILRFTLIKKGTPGEIYKFVANCWFESTLANQLKTRFKKITNGEESSDKYNEQTNFVRTAICKLNNFLLKNDFNLRLHAPKKTKKYILTPFVKYCIVCKKII